MGKTSIGRRGKVVAAATAALLATGGLSALAAKPAITANDAAEPANLGQVKNDIKSFYGDYLDAAGHHHASERSDWAKQTDAQIAKAKKFLNKQLSTGVQHPALVLDIDDTSQVTYGFAADDDFGYDSAKAEQAINNNEFPAIKSTLALTKWATQRNVKLYFITGRPEHQRAATAADLREQGFPKPAGLFLKPEVTAPAYLPCGVKCTTIQYKSGTRAHIEEGGDRIVVNIGDQFSDLEGGSAMQGYKLPNPMYYLP